MLGTSIAEVRLLVHQEGVHPVATIVVNLEQVDSFIEVCEVTARDCDVVERVGFSNFVQFRVFLDPQHLVKELKRFVFGLRIFQPLVLLALPVVFVQAFRAFGALGRDESFSTQHIGHLFGCHELDGFLKDFWVTHPEFF